MACHQYTIADLDIFAWLRSWENQGMDWVDYPHLKKRFDLLGARPAVQRGVKDLADLRKPLTGNRERDILFGKAQYEKRQAAMAGLVALSCIRC
jgi:GST-like protein